MSFRSRTRVENWRHSYQGTRMLTHYGHRKNAESHLKKEHFMSHRVMRKYWCDENEGLYGPCRMYSRYLSWYCAAHGDNANNCVCKDENGEPLNQCNECPR